MTDQAHPRRTILVVDDEELVRKSFTLILSSEGYECVEAEDATAARELLRTNSFDLVLCDIRMPGPSGIDLLRQISAELPNIATVMVTGIDDPGLADEALEIGAYGYIVKPFGPNELLIGVMNALRRRDLEIQARAYSEELESKLVDRTSALGHALRMLGELDSEKLEVKKEVLERLTMALALRDEETGRHIERVGLYTALLAELKGVEAWTPAMIRRASMLHDVGKIGVPDAILLKPAKLTDNEMSIVKRHCELGYQLLSGSRSPLLDLAANIALTHHERWDGTGYPRGLPAELSPIEGRLTAITDTFDALSSNRVYRPAFSVDDALAIIEQERGTHFEPELTDLFLRFSSEFIAIREEFVDSVDSSDSIKVLVIDEQELFTDMLMRFLATAGEINIIGTAQNMREALERIGKTSPDVVLMGWQLPDANGATAAKAILEKSPASRIVVLTGLHEDAVLAAAIDAGCSGFLSKSRVLEDVIQAIHDAHRGEVTISLSKLSSIVTRLGTESRSSTALTDREREVLELLAEGLSNQAIAERLVLSPLTVRNHVQRIITKLQAHSKLEAVTAALRQGIIEIPSLVSN